VRTTIVIDDQLMAEAIRLSGARTRKQAVEEGLRLLIRIKLQEQQQVRRLRGRLRWTGDLDAMRRD
jgi:Arc/MetJ family transcription regulator